MRPYDIVRLGLVSVAVAVLAAARPLVEATGGAFDPTAGPLVRLWREARATGRLPDAGAIASARALVGFRHVEFDSRARTARLALPGMRLDLGAIAKGFAADRAIDALARFGFESALAEAGGDIALGEAPPGAAGWRIEIPGGGSLVASRRGVSTSGDTEQFALVEGRRYSHVVDPRSGLAIQHAATVTVVAECATTSDALASALSVAGPSRARALGESMAHVAARFRWRTSDGTMLTEETRSFAGLLAGASP